MKVVQMARISKALGDPHRLAILKKLRQKKEFIESSDIQEVVNLAQPSISHHLKQLVDAGILIPTKEGRNRKYALNKRVLKDYAKAVAGFC